MNKLLKVLQHPWEWKELQRLDPEPLDLAYISSVVLRGSKIHHLVAQKVNTEIGKPFVRGVTYPTLIRLLSVAVNAF